MAKYVSPRKAAEYFGVTVQTLRNWEAAEKISTMRTHTNHRRYDIESYQGRGASKNSGAIIAYARVSSRKQKADLDRQIATLQQLYPGAEVITDIASGLNFRRVGLCAVLERVRSGNVRCVVVAHKDRLARFGFDLFKWLFEQDNCQLLVLNQDHLSPERELVEEYPCHCPRLLM